MDVQTDDKGRLKIDIRSLEDRETFGGRLQFDRPLNFPVKTREGKVVGKTFMFTVQAEVDERQENVAIFVPDYLRSGIYGVPLYKELSEYHRGDRIDIEKRVLPSEKSGRHFHAYIVNDKTDIKQAKVEETREETKPVVKKPRKLQSKPGKVSIRETIEEILDEENLEVEDAEGVDALLKEVIGNVKDIQSKEAIRKYILSLL